MSKMIRENAAPEVTMFQVIAVRAAIKMYGMTGMQANRAYTPKRLKAFAEEVTGKTFKRGAYADMHDALSEIVGDGKLYPRKP